MRNHYRRPVQIIDGVEHVACWKCHKLLPATPEFFHRNRLRRFGISESCKQCCRAYYNGYYHKNKHTVAIKGKKWREKNSIRVAESRRRNKLKAVFGISPEEWVVMFGRQEGLCAICGCPETSTVRGKRKLLHVDHDHETGKVRGLLCNKCNPMLGSAKDNPVILRGAAEYLETGRVR